MRTHFLKLWIIVLCSTAIFVASAVTYNQGDVLIGFHATSGQGNFNTYIFNLGPMTQFRDATSSFTLPTSLGNDLTTIYGPGWYTRGDLLFGVAGSPLNSISGTF
ncbi:MAG: hypothetical protein ACR2NX_09630 [Chthoniobacterales bacterium]